MKWILALLCAAIMGVPEMLRADEAQWTESPAGRTIFERFPDEAPYPYASRANGHQYEGKTYDRAGHYTDSTVGIFVPAGFTPSPQGVSFIVHFHGWKNHVTRVLDYYKMREQVAASHVNAILIVPQGPYDAPDSDFGRLEHEPGAFSKLMDRVAGFLVEQHVIPAATINNIVLSAHSGGYGGLSGTLKIGGLPNKVTDVLLFDSAYGKLDGFSNWLAGGPHRRLITLFTDDTISGNVELLSMLQKTPLVSRVIMRKDVSPNLLHKRGATFIYTPDLPHDETMQKYDYFALFLSTSALPSSRL